MGFFDFFTNMNNNANMELNNTPTEEPKKVRLSKVLGFDEEFSQDLAEPTNINTEKLNRSYLDNGVQVNGVTNTLKITYNGILAKNNAPEVYAVIGYGNNLQWENVHTYLMHKIGNQMFELVFEVKRQGNVNIAFKDSMDTWDNNNGMNYTFIDSFYHGSH